MLRLLLLTEFRPQYEATTTCRVLLNKGIDASLCRIEGDPKRLVVGISMHYPVRALVLKLACHLAVAASRRAIEPDVVRVCGPARQYLNLHE